MLGAKILSRAQENGIDKDIVSKVLVELNERLAFDLVWKVRSHESRFVNKQRMALIDDSTESMVSMGSGLDASSKIGTSRTDTRATKEPAEIVGPSGLMRGKSARMSWA